MVCSYNLVIVNKRDEVICSVFYKLLISGVNKHADSRTGWVEGDSPFS